MAPPNRRLSRPLKRRVTPEPPRTIDTSSQNQPDAPSLPSASADGVSAFTARVLDQLSLTAWLPAALLTAALAVIFQFQGDGKLDLPLAVTKLAADPLRLLVLIGPLLIIATMVTQAFSFSAIRALEGYWRRRGLMNLLRVAMTKWQKRRKESLILRLQSSEEHAFACTRPKLLRQGIPVKLVWAMEADLYGQDRPDMTTDEEADFSAMRWEDSCDPWLISKVEHLQEEVGRYPTASRLLPTALGNTLRSTEDKLRNTRGDLEGFAFEGRQRVSPVVQIQHDQFRDRLDMYCTLVFVASLLAVLAPALLLPSGIPVMQVGGLSLGFIALGVTSYFAALSSAEGYCTVLREMDRKLSEVEQE